MACTTTEGTFECDGAKLYTKTWTPEGPIKAKLIFVHGYSDHINLYNDFFPLVAARGIQVLSWDQRGWGRSVTKPAERGLTGTTERVVADIAAFIQDKLPSAEPIFVMGHSMGGGEILTLAGDAKHEGVVSQVRGWIAETPFIGFTPEEEPGFLKVFLGRLVGRLLPRQHMHQVVEPGIVTRDPAVAEAIRKDPLCHNTGTLEGLASMLDRTEALSSGQVILGKHVQSLYFAHTPNDRVCSFQKAMAWYELQTIEDKTSKSYDGAYHQLHTDPLKEEWLNDFVEWMLKRSGDSAAPAMSKL
ncbi:Alpha/Beta hydrolase protein [Stachybotrys elegans]|uniref:Alpha/Beta hydrolase protein n=1 Tax=Stachybotrys elegans TaxID=80388 RepID=A0A8K0SIZ1_9HYPO|nr:Alpha/Beta hydrolase protein [Stachybotrys elegans]